MGGGSNFPSQPEPLNHVVASARLGELPCEYDNLWALVDMGRSVDCQHCMCVIFYKRCC